MSERRRIDEDTRRRDPWVRRGIVETLKGGVVGLLTASLLVVASLELFPGLADFDYDTGLRMHKFADEYLSFWATGMTPDVKHVDSYVFIDVDPQPGPSAAISGDDADACSALARVANRCYVTQSGVPSLTDRAGCAQGQVVLNCSTARPLNRHLLAEVVKGLRERGARLIVLAVELADEPGIVDRAENLSLRDAMRQSGSANAPVIFAQPAEYDSQHEPTGSYSVRADPARLFDTGLPADASHATAGSGRPAFAGIALPAPGQPVRRYPKCFRNVWHGATPSPSLPFLAAALLDHPEMDPASLCPASSGGGSGLNDGPYASPRIRFTLPSLDAHQDATRDGEDFRIWSVYRQVYNRCLAAKFWSSESLCSRPETYRGKVAVIGASSFLRRDRHYTPIGNMTGAEVVINATRSFVLNPLGRDKSVLEAVLKKGWIVLVCLIPWFVFFCISEYRKRFTPGTCRDAITLFVFVVTLAVVVGITFKMSYSSFSALVGVLTIAIEQYIHLLTTCVLNPLEGRLKWALRLPNDSTH